MDNIVVVDGFVATDNLFENRECLILSKGFFVFDRFGKVLITQFSDDVDVIFGVVYIVDADDILLVFELLKNSNLILE